MRLMEPVSGDGSKVDHRLKGGQTLGILLNGSPLKVSDALEVYLDDERVGQIADRQSKTEVLAYLIGVAQKTEGAEVWRALFAEMRAGYKKERDGMLAELRAAE